MIVWAVLLLLALLAAGATRSKGIRGCAAVLATVIVLCLAYAAASSP